MTRQLNYSLKKIILFILLMSICSLAHADEDQSLCKLLIKEKENSEPITPLSLSTLFLHFADSIFNNDDAQEENLSNTNTVTPSSTAVYTIGTGFALRDTCNKNVRYTSGMFYPVGLTGLKIGEIQIGNALESDENKQKQKFIHILTEYGLSLYIPSANVREMKANYTYVFADSENSIEYCAGQSECKSKKSRKINAKFLYGIIDKPNVSTTIREDIKAKRCGMQYPFTPMNARDALKKEAGGPTGENSAKFSSCVSKDEKGVSKDEKGVSKDEKGVSKDEKGVSKDEKGEINEELKVIWREKVKEDFKHIVQGKYYRLKSTDFESLLNQTNVISHKTCEETKTETTINMFRWGVGTGQKMFEGSARRINENKTSHTLPIGYYYTYSIFSWNANKNKAVEVQDIISKAKCNENLEPSVGVVVKIFSKEFSNNPLVINVDVMKNWYSKRYTDGEGYRGTAPYIDIEDSDKSHPGSPNAVSLGMFWEINGYDQYFKWRNAIMDMLDDNRVITNLTNLMPEKRKKSIKNFITHLFLISAFSYKKKVKNNHP